MTKEKFYEWLQDQPAEDKVVYMRYKYSWENEWTVSYEYLMVDGNDFLWLYDWSEGEEDVEILGCIDIDKIDFPLFEQETLNKGE